jgi:aminoglycoside 2'-N-acetyltransferase I
MHVWLVGSRGLISHGSLVERTLILANHTMRVGYVEAVATAEAHRRKGYSTIIMKRLGD